MSVLPDDTVTLVVRYDGHGAITKVIAACRTIDDAGTLADLVRSGTDFPGEIGLVEDVVFYDIETE